MERVAARVESVILGKKDPIRLALTCLVAGGHLLIEDLPGVGKTTLAQVLARVLGLEFRRVQFTSDLLPADLLGVSIFDRDSGRFRFHPGPIFSQVVLADEVNRATPKTQSALLEAMEERQVTVEGETRPLPQPFFVIATQNPANLIGTFPLPESQLDRFLMRIRLGYPDAAAERELLLGEERRRILEHLAPVLVAGDLVAVQERAATVHVAPALVDYLQALIAFSRSSPHYRVGLSPRAGLALLRSARAFAFLDGRREVLPEDLQAILPGVVGHRLCLTGAPGEEAAEHLKSHVAVP
ncbi:MAG: AAA family ATPase [Magnetococcales bacterium]|nr:AAA family ATPase [Magnetococcales bacterium]